MSFDHVIWFAIFFAAGFLSFTTRRGFTHYKLMPARMRSALNAHTICSWAFGFASCIWLAYLLG